MLKVTRSHPLETPLLSSLKSVARLASAAVILAGCLALLGWALDIPTLKSALPGAASMKANTAAAFLLCGTSLWLALWQPAPSLARRLAQGCALTAALIGLLTLSQYLFGWNLGIDHLLFREVPGGVGTSYPGRMAPATAVNFLLTGSALVLLSRNRRREAAQAQLLALTAGLLCLQPLTGYICGFPSLYGTASHTEMAPHTALAFTVLSAGIWLARPAEGVMAAVTSDRPGGFMARRLLLAATPIPFLLGWLILQGYRAGLYDIAYGLSLLLIGNAVVLAALIWRNATLLDRLDSHRLQAERAQRLSESRFSRLFESNVTGIFIVSNSGKISQANDAFLEMLGRTREELLSGFLSWEAITPPEYSAAGVPAIEGLPLSGARTPCEQEFVRFDGSRVPVLVGAAPLEGEPQQTIGFALDISHRKQAEEALRESESRLRRLLDSNIIGLAIGNFQGNIIEANDAFLDMVGHTRSDLQQGKVNFIDLTPPEHRHKDERAMEEMKKTGSHKPFEKEYIRKDGSRVPVLVGTAYFGGTSEMGVGFLLDLTERKQAEESLRQLASRVEEQAYALDGILSASVDNIYILDRAGRYKYVSAGGARVLGFEPGEIAGKTWRELGLPAEIMEPFDAQREEVLSTGKPLKTETNFLTAGGAVRHYEYIIAPLLEPDGSIEGVVVVSRDITSRVHAEQALRESREQLQLAFDAARLGMWDWNLLSGKIIWSGEHERLFGMEPGAFRGTYEEFRERIHPEDVKKVEEAISRSMRERADCAAEYRVIWPDGSLHWIAAKGRLFSGENGQPLRMTGAVTDITARKQAEEALRISETRFRTLVEQSPLSVQILDLSGRIVQANRAWEELWGVTLDRIPEYNVLRDEQLVALGVMPHIKKAFAGEAAAIPPVAYDPNQTLPNRTEHKDPLRWVQALVYPVKDEGGNIREVVLMQEDITERVRMEEALRLSEGKFRRLAESNIIGVIIADFQGKITEANDAFLEMIGYTREDLAAGKIDWTEITPPEYLPQDRRIIEELQRNGTCAPFEKEYIRKDKSRVPLLLGCARLEEPPDTTICFVLDLTERKRAQEALRETNQTLEAIVQACPLAITVFGTDDGKVKLWNPAAERIFGWSAQEALGRFVPSVPEDKRDEFLANLEAVRQGKILAGMESRRQKKGGQPIDIAVWAALLRDAKGGVSCMSIVADITERKKLEEERRQLLVREQEARKEAEAANRAKDEFLATLSHELRTPLNPMLGWTQLLRARKFDERTTARALETIERNIKLLSQLIEDVLDVSRIITGKLRLNVAPVELARVIEAAVETVRPAADARKIRIESRFDLSVGQVSGDASRLQQVVWNLLSNALKFTPEGGRIEVRLSVVTGNGAPDTGHQALGPIVNPPILNLQSKIPNPQSKILNPQSPIQNPKSKIQNPPALNAQCPVPCAQIQVTDTGIGIAPEFVPFVFERFRQADGSITRTHGGLGLGLAIVRHLVELHGGAVRADSPGEGRGATFTIYLPLREKSGGVGELRERGPAPALASVAPVSLAGLRVLVVDDEADARELLIAALAEYGAQVTARACASEALEALAQLQPHVLVSDLGMPKEDGYSLIRKVRALDAESVRGIPAVALTAYARAEDRTQALLAGFQLHVPKPVDPAELAVAIANLAGRTGNA